MVRGSGEEALWDFLIHHHHYLGWPLIVGAYLKYLVHLAGCLVAAVGWGSAKRRSCYTYQGQAKAVFVYPLTRHFRERLHG